MKDGPDIARVAALIGDPARANILTSLMSGKALTVTELAAEAGVTIQTASSHLAKLEEGGLVKPRKEGRHKYFMLNGSPAAKVIESLMGFAAGEGQLRTRTGPRDGALRQARVCYNHLAGEAGIRMYDSLLQQRLLHLDDDGLSLSRKGHAFAKDLGIDIEELVSGRTVLCRECLDWSERKSHLAGSLGRALFDTLQQHGIVKRDQNSRVVHFGHKGPQAFEKLFPLTAP
jgi:DNA-binding transcriptional ArsR family regulator